MSTFIFHCYRKNTINQDQQGAVLYCCDLPSIEANNMDVYGEVTIPTTITTITTTTTTTTATATSTTATTITTSTTLKKKNLSGYYYTI